MLQLDLTSYRCPYVLVQVKMSIKALAKGEMIVVFLSDPGSYKDVPAWAEKSGHKVEVYRHDDQRSVQGLNQQAIDFIYHKINQLNVTAICITKN